VARVAVGPRCCGHGLQWVLPSPQLPTPTTVLYRVPGMSRASLRRGRGTTRPFELIGEPTNRLAVGQVETRPHPPGVRFLGRMTGYRTFRKFGEPDLAGGVQVQPDERERSRPDPHRRHHDRHRESWIQAFSGGGDNDIDN